MDRYTKRLNDGQAAMDCETCRKTCGKYGDYCSALYCRNRLKDRLAEYEDILENGYDLNSLMEAVEKQAEYESFMKKWKQAVEIAGAAKQVGAERVAELVEADRDGRCVVLPCNLGDHIYRVVAGYIFEGIFFIEDAPRFGKNVFLTREAAEEALRENQHEKCL